MDRNEKKKDRMDTLFPGELREVIEHHDEFCVSIFLPTHVGGPEIQQDPIRLKNLLRQAETKLLEQGLRAPEAKSHLEPIQGLLTDGSFWRHQSQGLAVFRSSDLFHYYRLPVDFREIVIVSHRFHIKPLLPLLSGDIPFYILALSQNDVRLLQGTRYRVDRIDLEEVPKSLAEALKYDDPERQLQFHTGTSSEGQAKRPAMFHGHGVGIDDSKDNILRYFQHVNEGLRRFLRSEKAPLVLAAVDYLFPLYREANTYPCLLSEGIEGNPEELSMESLHSEAWAIVEPYALKDQKEAAKRYRSLAGSGRTSKGIRRIVRAAHDGRIEVLFVALDVEKWGSFDPDADRMHLYRAFKPGGEDLLDLAAAHTFLRGGAVYAVRKDQMPDHASIAAIFRY